MLNVVTNSNKNDALVITADLELILDNSSDIVFIKDNANNILFANKVACDLLNKQKQEIIGFSAEEIFTAQDARKFYKDDLKIIESRKPLHKVIESITDNKGKCHVVITDKIPILNSRNQVEKIIVIKKSLEKQNCEVKKIALELKDIKARFDEFGYILRHDLLEPVRMIASFSELIEKLLRSHKIKDDKLSKYLSFVQDSCKRMKQIVLKTKKSIKK